MGLLPCGSLFTFVDAGYNQNYVKKLKKVRVVSKPERANAQTRRAVRSRAKKGFDKTNLQTIES
jgi:hypothetical protein